jgi:ELWxxDGT repeat protein
VTGSSPLSLTNVQGMLYFTAYTTVHGRELWKSDGTSEGTLMIKDRIEESWGIENLTASNGKLFYTDSEENGIQGLYISDGTEAGTLLLKHFKQGFIIGNFTDKKGTLYFTVTDDDESDGEQGTELWKSDGTAEGTVIVKNISNGSLWTTPYEFAFIDDILFFLTNNYENGFELWKSDGTEEGTQLIKNLGRYTTQPSDMLDVNGVLYFHADYHTNGRQLWMSMGSNCNTIPLTNDSELFSGRGMALLNQKIILPATSTDFGTELFGYNMVNDIKKPVVTLNNSNPGTPMLSSGMAYGNYWMKDGEVIDNATETTYAVTTSGIYSVRIMSDGCLFATSEPLEVLINPTRTDITDHPEIKVYPNPAEHMITVGTPGGNISRIQIIGVNGMVISDETVGKEEIYLNVGHYPAGLYVIKIITKDAIETRTFIKM